MTFAKPYIIPAIAAAALGVAALAFAFSHGVPAHAAVSSGDLVKASLPAVYYVGANGKRYVFVNDKAYFTWYSDFSSVKQISDSELAALTIGGNITYRPGVKMVKIQSDPKVYAVSHGGVLRPIGSETVAASLYGGNWNTKIDDIADGFFVNYTVGAPINDASTYSVSGELASSPTVNADKGLTPVSPAPPPPPPPPPPQPLSCSPACGTGSACSNNMCRAIPGPSPILVRAVTIDYADVCFVGDACTGGSCCSVDGLAFADNANLKTVFPRDKYLYGDKQQLCGRANLSIYDRNRISESFNTFASGVEADTNSRITVSVNQTHISGELTMSRKAGGCDWWFSPEDLRARMAGQIDQSVDAVIVSNARTFDFGVVNGPDRMSVDQSQGIGGAGYSAVARESDNEAGGMPLSSVYRNAFDEQYSSAYALGVADPNANTTIMNHCRNLKKDLDEVGVDCGGSSCNACM